VLIAVRLMSAVGANFFEARMSLPPDKQLAAALGRIPSGLFILTLRRGDLETGMLASWVQQCSFAPPCVSVAIQKGREIGALLTPHSTFCLNVLEEGQTDLIAHFGRGFSLKEDAFSGLTCQRGRPEGAILSESLAQLDCQVLNRFGAGDHDLILAQILAGGMLSEGQPMVHIRKNGLHY
jgi:flavin reductase (DIM6/NTAB) family NADH-FMN oxidoreductase RutF